MGENTLMPAKICPLRKAICNNYDGNTKRCYNQAFGWTEIKKFKACPWPNTPSKSKKVAK